MPRTDNRGQHSPNDFSPHAGLQGVNLPAIPFHGTREDQVDLMHAVIHHIGPCECVVHSDPRGNVCQGHPCAGHLFLCETDDAGRTLEWSVPGIFGATHFTSGSLSNCVTRLDRLMFARSQRGRWEAQEWADLKRVDPKSPLPGDSRNPEDFPW